MNPNDLAFYIDEVIRGTLSPIPETLRKLAEISSFRLYITTTIDHLLKRALEESRAGRGETIGEVKFRPLNKIDLRHSPGPDECTLFYLFGACSETPGTFAATEDDLIEFSWALLDKGNQ